MAEDRFANVFSAEVTESAANTLTFAQLNFGITFRDKMAIVVDQIFWLLIGGVLDDFDAEGDGVSMALTTSDQVTDITDFADTRVLVLKMLRTITLGTMADSHILEQPYVSSFTPPLIVIPTRLYLAVWGSSLAAAAILRARIHFRTVPVSTEQQLTEVLETFQLTT